MTEATLPWIILFTVIIVGSGWGFGMFVAALARALHTAWWDLHDWYWNRKDKTT